MLRGYHGTWKERVPSIQETGVGGNGTTACFTLDDHDVLNHLGIERSLASPDDESALWLARQWGDGTVIVVDLDGIDAEVFEDEGDGGSSWEMQVDVVPPARIVEVILP